MTELEKLLRRMAEGDVPYPNFGVSMNLEMFAGFGTTWVREFDLIYPSDLMKHWPECCDDGLYPIAGRHEYEVPGQFWAGENGEKRKRLCLWLADLLALRDAGL